MSSLARWVSVGFTMMTLSLAVTITARAQSSSGPDGEPAQAAPEADASVSGASDGDVPVPPAPATSGVAPSVALAPPLATPLALSPCIADPGRAERLGGWIEARADYERSSLVWTSIIRMIGGAIFVGLGVWDFADDVLDQWVRPTLGSFAIGVGAIFFAQGLFHLISPPLAIARRGRWREALEGGLSAAELAAFEGEMREEALRAQQERTFVMVGGIATAVAGGAIATTTALVDGLDSGDRILGYTIGGAVGGAGLILFALSFMTSSEEDAWNAYSRGEGPRAGLEVHPVIGLGSLGVTGTF